MENQEQIDKVLKTLRQLKNMYEGAKKINSEGEAAAAAAAIQRLLLKYNLSMEQVDMTEPDKDPILKENVSGFTYKSIGGDWEMYLTSVLCRHNFCRCLQYGTIHKLVIVGKRENIETVKWLRDMLSERYVNFSKTKYKEYIESGEYYKPMSKDRYQRGYLKGCAAGLDAKLTEEEKKDKEQDVEFGAKVTALVVRNDAAIEEFIANEWGKLGKSRRSGTRASGAFYEGYEEGKKTEIYKPIADSHHESAKSIQLLK